MQNLQAKGYIDTAATNGLISAALTVATLQDTVVVTSVLPLAKSNTISVTRTANGKKLSPDLQSFNALGNNQYEYKFAHVEIGASTGNAITARIKVNGGQELAFINLQLAAAIAAANAVQPGYNRVDATGTDTYVGTPSPAITAYNNKQVFLVKFANANTGPATINLNALGAKAIKKAATVALASGDIVAGKIYTLAYDGTNFQIV